MASVLVLVGPNKGELYPFDEAVGDGAVIGRDPECQVQLTDERVSRHHARIALDASDGACRISDLGSVNGTQVNGVKIEGRAILRDGDTIGIGHTLLRFSDRKLSHAAKDYADMQHIPRPKERFRDTQA
jgi:pSer/pThr/pTyr-binding forkhead associated (FHA) protein